LGALIKNRWLLADMAGSHTERMILIARKMAFAPGRWSRNNVYRVPFGFAAELEPGGSTDS